MPERRQSRLAQVARHAYNCSSSSLSQLQPYPVSELTPLDSSRAGMWQWSPRCVWLCSLAGQSFRAWCACRSSPRPASCSSSCFQFSQKFGIFKIKFFWVFFLFTLVRNGVLEIFPSVLHTSNVKMEILRDF